MIRVLFCTLLAAWAVLPLRADDRGRALVRSLSAKIASYVSYEVLFTADMDGEFDGVQGRIVVNGDRYRVEVNGSELYCDGKLLYTFRADEDEAGDGRRSSVESRTGRIDERAMRTRIGKFRRCCFFCGLSVSPTGKA